MTFYFLGSLTAFTNVFGTGFAYLFFACDYAGKDVTPQCFDWYLVGIAVFGVIAAVLAALDYKEQAVFQYIMMCLQLFIVLIVLVYAFYHLSKPEKPGFVLVDSDYLGQSFALIVLAANYHGVFPSILAASQKSQAVQKSVIIAVAITVIIVYGSMGVVSALVIPDLPPNASHLLSQEYFGYTATTLPRVLAALKELVVIFPVLDICSNAPIVAQSLAGVVTSWGWGSDHAQVRRSHPYLFRLGRAFCLFPAVLLASSSHNFVLLTQAALAGLPGMMLILLIMTYVPVCYNRAMDCLEVKSGFDLSWKGIRGFNWALSLCAFCVFCTLLRQRLDRVL